MKYVENEESTGAIGEKIATEYLRSKNFEVLSRNYRNKWGEIDIVGKKNRRTYFFEIKSVACENESEVLTRRPEERVHSDKIKKLQRIIRTYLLEKFGTEEYEFEFRVVTISMVRSSKRAFVRVIRDVL